MPSLVFTSGNSKPLIFALDQPVITLGRSNDCDIVLQLASIASKQALIKWEGGSFVVYQLGSSQSTRVNGQSVQCKMLQHGDLLQIETYRFTVDLFDGRSLPQAQTTRPRVAERKSVPVSMASMPLAAAAGPTFVHLRPVQSSQRRTSTIRGAAAGFSTARAPTDYAFASMVLGCLGFVAFLPAIIMGHFAPIVNASSRMYRKIGLMLGYLFLVLWIAVGIHLGWFERLASTAGSSLSAHGSVMPPKVLKEAALPLLAGSITWTPEDSSLKQIFSNEADLQNFSYDSSKSVNPREAREKFITAWNDGLVVYEPSLLRCEADMNDPRMIRFVLEEINQPAFNPGASFLSPESKRILGPFFISHFDSNFLFFNVPLSRSSVLSGYNNRGIRWKLAEHISYVGEDIAQWRWVALLKPASKPSTVLFSSKMNDQVMSLYPSEVLAEFIYNGATEEVVSVRLNEKLYSVEDQETAALILRSNLSNILSQRSRKPNEIPRTFYMYAPTRDTLMSARALEPRL
jgi:hypothetical protein